MLRRLTSLAPLTPALALIVFAAAGAGAQGAAGLAGPNALADVQVGEQGRRMRVAVICREDCRVGARASGVFFIPGLTESLDVDLKGRSVNAERLLFEPGEGGATLAVKSARNIVAASITRCIIDEAPASCIDMEFETPAKSVAVAKDATIAAPAPKPSAPTRPAQATPNLSVIQPLAAAPILREETGGDLLVFASLEPPERFEPPASVPLARNEAPAPTGEGPRLILDRRKAEALLGAEVDIGREATTILGRSFDADDCAAADAKLKADAWALDAMVNIGFCEAIVGRLDQAKGVFERLLAYTPDNYEALVGEALVAAKEGDAARAEALFQDALNALPPIAESDRIVAAMDRL